MAISNVRRRQLIDSALARHSDDATQAPTQPWDQLASQLVSLIGEGGFHALYARSLHLSRTDFPWLPCVGAALSVDVGFEALRSSLEGQDAAHANKANRMLLLTFTDILASLVGEPLTTDILSSAWGDGASDRDIVGRDIAGKETPNA